MKKIGLFGGSFDPIHRGHLAVAQTVTTRCGLDKVIFIPAYCSSHKQGRTYASAQDRWTMVNLAIAQDPKMACSDFEVRRACLSYTIDTARHFQRIFKEKAQLFFIMGQDSLVGLPTWKEVEALRALVTFIVVNRPDTDEVVDPGVIERVEMEGMAVSSTVVRQSLKRGEAIDELVPRRVAEYIQNKHLYQ